MDIYQEVTDRIIAQLDQGIIPWHKPWIASGSAISHATGHSYSLLNQILLGEPGEYITLKQCQAEGGKIRKGEKSSMVVFWKFITQEDEETHEKKQVPFLRYFSVFHIDQCEGIHPKYEKRTKQPAQPDEAAEQIISAYVQSSGIKLIHQEGDHAFYQPSTDSVTLPLLAQFESTAEYYSTAFHELTHSTGHSSRLDRLSKTAFFGSEAYSKEELTAELGASALVSHCGIETSSSFRNNVAYIQNWLQALQNDKRLIVSASGKAEKAVDWILNSQH